MQLRRIAYLYFQHAEKLLAVGDCGSTKNLGGSTHGAVHVPTRRTRFSLIFHFLRVFLLPICSGIKILLSAVIMKFEDYKAALTERKKSEEQQYGKDESSAKLLQRYRMSIAKDVKAAKWENFKVDLAQAAVAGNFRTKPLAYYHELEDLIAKTREADTTRKEKQQQKDKQHKKQTEFDKAYVDKKVSSLKMAVQEELKVFEASVDTKIADFAERTHRQMCKESCATLCAHRPLASARSYVHDGSLWYIFLGALICLISWWRSRSIITKHAAFEKQLRHDGRNGSRSQKLERIREEGWEDIDDENDGNTRSAQQAIELS